jgi:hypothetical protein
MAGCSARFGCAPPMAGSQVECLCLGHRDVEATVDAKVVARLQTNWRHDAEPIGSTAHEQVHQDVAFCRVARSSKGELCSARQHDKPAGSDCAGQEAAATETPRGSTVVGTSSGRCGFDYL